VPPSSLAWDFAISTTSAPSASLSPAMRRTISSIVADSLVSIFRSAFATRASTYAKLAR
jgi:hypothetical protein